MSHLLTGTHSQRNSIGWGSLTQLFRSEPSASLAAIRAAIIAAIKGASYLHIPEDRRDHTTLRLHGLD